ncbi:hypothetical protein MJO28_009889 [Puccinia striiformis f. sp. tritici]|uniref:Uncharacterized protein n=3 Tax=Puccinia striiformis TaxID=27350 RepID=A0A0L0VN56_9BASI|nr:hypothetical protein Pst134EA_017274 [Puccinia striiformis f. sp. tritici]KAI9622483.1 hypothetical protein H4Q26_015164 [Puccinia striiformis f. sp. tritici PST-130]KNF00718.1 hypothetical protein PSTG_06132 [Puccinia striiformis f. sp. tritici PST-78]POW04356.1 hypothetical protein PSTT_10445 [Puccinia striiformis]KAH9460966.1 hypothetical protein Pst134EA_017274 [Puccinia striiformis f. sp. tritici]KAI7947981.1 hypothetical protein MJO28_009889 [Puccinia striiformis f. sp. tritici]
MVHQHNLLSFAIVAQNPAGGGLPFVPSASVSITPTDLILSWKRRLFCTTNSSLSLQLFRRFSPLHSPISLSPVPSPPAQGSKMEQTNDTNNIYEGMDEVTADSIACLLATEPLLDEYGFPLEPLYQYEMLREDDDQDLVDLVAFINQSYTQPPGRLPEASGSGSQDLPPPSSGNAEAGPSRVTIEALEARGDASPSSSSGKRRHEDDIPVTPAPEACPVAVHRRVLALVSRQRDDDATQGRGTPPRPRPDAQGVLERRPWIIPGGLDPDAEGTDEESADEESADEERADGEDDESADEEAGESADQEDDESAEEDEEGGDEEDGEGVYDERNRRRDDQDDEEEQSRPRSRRRLG